MTDRWRFVLLLVLSVSFAFGSLLALVSFINIDSMMFFVFLSLIGVIVVILMYILRKVYLDLRMNIPANDERTTRIKTHTAGYAYIISLNFWLVLWVFRNQLDQDDVILLGLFGMVLSFPLSYLLFVRKRKDFT